MSRDPRIDYDRVARSYHRARDMPLDALAPWRAALVPFLPPGTRLPILDVGSGTGLFSRAFTRWFGVAVIAVEPSGGMREEARRLGVNPRVLLVAGRAEALPLRDGSGGGAWLSTVIHHVGTLDACAHELRRVLAPGAPVLIRGTFPSLLDGVTLFRYFPEAARIAATFPSIEDTCTVFGAAGFTRAGLDQVPQVSAPSLRVFGARVRRGRHADSTLAPLTDAEFARGLRVLETDAAAERAPTPVVDRLTLLVFR